MDFTTDKLAYSEIHPFISGHSWVHKDFTAGRLVNDVAQTNNDCSPLNYSFSCTKIDTMENAAKLCYSSAQLILQLLEALIASLGIVTNCVTLFIFYRLKWHRRPIMVYLVATIITNTVTCSGISAKAWLLYAATTREEFVWTQYKCIGVSTLSVVGLSITTNFAVLISIDRLFCQWKSYWWVRVKIIYKWLSIVLCWVMPVLLQCSYFFIIDPDICVLFCFWDLSGYPDAPVIQKMGASWEVISNGFTLGTLLLVPLVTAIKGKSFVQLFKRETFIMSSCNVFLRSRENIARVRFLSVVYLCGFVCTFTAVGIAEKISSKLNVNQVTLAYFQVGAIIWLSIHTVFAPFLFILDASFRWELKRQLKRLLFIRKK